MLTRSLLTSALPARRRRRWRWLILPRLRQVGRRVAVERHRSRLMQDRVEQARTQHMERHMYLRRNA